MLVSGRKLIHVIKKIRLKAVLFQDEGRIVVDASLPKGKQEWPSLHEAGHRILEWHRPYFFGDTAQTLNPDWQQQLEEEANYAASTLMFCNPIFATEAKDAKPGWASIEELKKRYKKSYSTTLRRYQRSVRTGLSDGDARQHPAMDGETYDQENRCRHFVPSPVFARRFSQVTASQLIRQVDLSTRRRRGGPVGDSQSC